MPASSFRGPIKVRLGLHTGRPRLVSEGYVGADVHLTARLCAAGHGGQVLLSSATRELVSAELTDLGEHRLKDFATPISIYQLGSGSFPPLRTISNTNLPRPASSFVGRAREVAELSELLTDGARLVTPTGPGGTGKTRLAIETAAELVANFKAGIFWVSLAPLRDPGLVIETIATTLGAKGELGAHIAERQLLLVLDNLEQVVAAAPELATLLEACPNLRLLATSRERLRVRGEVVYPIAPLVETAAVELFCQRASVPRDESVVRLCAALEHLPLAIELAAARADLLSPAQITERLGQRLDLLRGGRDADPRQQTLRATIAWSYDLLTHDEQGLFRRFSVFRGGCALEAAQAVAQADLDTLAALLDKSLLRRRDDRYVMLETIREYAADQLEDSGEADVSRDGHLHYFTDRAEAAHEEETWYEVMADDDNNVRAALDWCAQTGRHARAAKLVGAVAHFWMQTGRSGEAKRRAPRRRAAARRTRHEPDQGTDLSGRDRNDRGRHRARRGAVRGGTLVGPSNGRSVVGGTGAGGDRPRPQR